MGGRRSGFRRLRILEHPKSCAESTSCRHRSDCSHKRRLVSSYIWWERCIRRATHADGEPLTLRADQETRRFFIASSTVGRGRWSHTGRVAVQNTGDQRVWSGDQRVWRSQTQVRSRWGCRGSRGGATCTVRSQEVIVSGVTSATGASGVIIPPPQHAYTQQLNRGRMRLHPGHRLREFRSCSSGLPPSHPSIPSPSATRASRPLQPASSRGLPSSRPHHPARNAQQRQHVAKHASPLPTWPA